MSGYIGPIPVPQGIQNKETFTATAGQTTFNTNGYTDGAFINVYLNGVRLINGTDYTATNGSDVVLTQAASVSDVLDFETFNSFSLVDQTFDNITLKNPTHEDTDGGRESAVSFKGEQSGGEISTLAAIQASHDGTSDDEKGELIFKTNDGNDGASPTEAMRIDSDGSIGIGVSPVYKFHQHESTSGANYHLFTNSSTGSTTGDGLRVGIDSNEDALMWLREGNNMKFATNDTERMRISSAGDVLIAKTVTTSSTAGARFTSGGSLELVRDGGQLLYVNRLTSDGTLISLAQGNSTEGTITVSGSTVSYNGGHLSRWSRLTSGNKDTSIVKGTVMTNLDKMVVWSHEAVAATYYEEGGELPKGVSVGDEKTPAVDAYTEDNEQLNCMAISSVEGDPNVAGVFVNWDDDDNFKDMNVAMTGDMVIRIAKGTTVARGDLLMSAGDGTAKPQDDDIVRSKTIAKVTSTNVSHTYDDESYLVPCVLMAC